MKEINSSSSYPSRHKLLSDARFCQKICSADVVSCRDTSSSSSRRLQKPRYYENVRVLNIIIFIFLIIFASQPLLCTSIKNDLEERRLSSSSKNDLVPHKTAKNTNGFNFLTSDIQEEAKYLQKNFCKMDFPVKIEGQKLVRSSSGLPFYVYSKDDVVSDQIRGVGDWERSVLHNILRTLSTPLPDHIQAMIYRYRLFKTVSRILKRLHLTSVNPAQTRILQKVAISVATAYNSISYNPETFLDIGANVGWYTINIARAGYKVIAVEGLDRNIIMLRNSICENDKTSFEKIESLPHPLREAIDQALKNAAIALNRLEDLGVDKTDSTAIATLNKIAAAAMDNVHSLPILKGVVSDLMQSLSIDRMSNNHHHNNSNDDDTKKSGLSEGSSSLLSLFNIWPKHKKPSTDIVELNNPKDPKYNTSFSKEDLAKMNGLATPWLGSGLTSKLITFYPFGLDSKNDTCYILSHLKNLGNGHVVCGKKNEQEARSIFPDSKNFRTEGSLILHRLDEVMARDLSLQAGGDDAWYIKLLKIDVEGFEMNVFGGMRSIFERRKHSNASDSALPRIFHRYTSSSSRWILPKEFPRIWHIMFEFNGPNLALQLAPHHPFAYIEYLLNLGYQISRASFSGPFLSLAELKAMCTSKVLLDFYATHRLLKATPSDFERELNAMRKEGLPKLP